MQKFNYGKRTKISKQNKAKTQNVKRNDEKKLCGSKTKNERQN
jgi:hypothetical protein